MDELLTPFPVKTFPLFLSASHFEVAKTLMLYAKIKTVSANRENKTKN